MISYFCNLLLGKVHNFVILQMRRSFFHREFSRQKKTDCLSSQLWVILGSEILFILNYVFVRTAGENDSKSDECPTNVESICSVGRAVISILRLRTSFPPLCQNNVSPPLPPPSCWRQLCVRPHSCPFAPKLCVYRGEGRGGKVPTAVLLPEERVWPQLRRAARERGEGVRLLPEAQLRLRFGAKICWGFNHLFEQNKDSLELAQLVAEGGGVGGWIFSMVLWVIWKPYQGLWCQWPRKCAVGEREGGE